MNLQMALEATHANISELNHRLYRINVALRGERPENPKNSPPKQLGGLMGKFEMLALALQESHEISREIESLLVDERMTGGIAEKRPY